MRCQIFISDCDLAIGLIGDVGEDFMSLYGQIREILSFSSIAEPNYDDVKRLLNTLFALHCPWSVIDGDIKTDAILGAIRKM